MAFRTNQLSAVWTRACLWIEAVLALRAADLAQEARRYVQPIGAGPRARCTRGRQGCVTVRAFGRCEIDRLLALGTRSCKQPIATRTDWRRGKQFLAAFGTIEIQRQTAVMTRSIFFSCRRKALRAECQAAHAAHTIFARGRGAAVWTMIAFFRRCIADDCAAMRTFKRAVGYFFMTLWAGHDERYFDVVFIIGE
jgi:hypothetical protein